jgi:hypothetical protein
MSQKEKQNGGCLRNNATAPKYQHQKNQFELFDSAVVFLIRLHLAEQKIKN